ncbi:MAG: hypothetical protein JXA73_10885 [Acidobacteria bacterium]|nr:hypothetical protein [Acidobacteriota bacterium]
MDKYAEILNQMLQIDLNINAILKTANKISQSLLIDKLEELVGLSSDFLKLKEQIKTEFVSVSTITIRDKKQRHLLERINANEEFLADKFAKSVEGLTGNKLHLESLNPKDADFNNLNEALLDEIASNELYSWWGPYDYVWGLVDIGILIVGASIPTNLRKFLNEARNCYAFKQYNAVYSLCRTILEASMRDVGIRNGTIKPIKDARDFYKEYPPRKLINSTTFGKVNGKVHDFYTEMSSVIHGRKTVNAEKAKTALKETISIVQILYKNIC